MRFVLLFVAAAEVSCSILPQTNISLPISAFPGFKTITIEDAETGKDLLYGFEYNVTHTSASQQQATVQTAEQAACSANPSIRYEWRQYSTESRLDFINAIRCLINKPPSGNFAPATNRYEDLVRLHQLYMPNIHENPKFLVWHRYFLWTFEMVLRDECGFDGVFPWWDETVDAGQFSKLDMFTNDAYFGRLPESQNGQASCICNSNFVSTCNSRTSYVDMESCSEYGPHAYGHNGIGGVMSDVSASPSDPIFWMHHSFIDHAFRIWQNAEQSRTHSISGTDHNGDPLNLDTMIYMGGIRPDVKVGDILDTQSGAVIGERLFCYRYNY